MTLQVPDLHDVAAEAAEEDLRDYLTVPTLQPIHGAPEDWLHGDNMALKAAGSLRCATLNIGAIAGGNNWTLGLAKSIQLLMLNLEIDILTLQEMHTVMVPGQTHYLHRDFHSLGLNLAMHAAAQTDRTSFTGVGILTPNSWLHGPIMIPTGETEGRTIGRIIAVDGGGSSRYTGGLITPARTTADLTHNIWPNCTNGSLTMGSPPS